MEMNQEHQRALEQIMMQMRGMFGRHFRLTLLARNASQVSTDKDILITEDNLDDVEGAVCRIRIERLNRGGANVVRLS